MTASSPRPLPQTSDSQPRYLGDGKVAVTRERLLKPGEVAELFRVDVKTVQRWAKQGRLACVTTPGGHRRYRASEIRALLTPDDGEPA